MRKLTKTKNSEGSNGMASHIQDNIYLRSRGSLRVLSRRQGRVYGVGVAQDGAARIDRVVMT